MQISKVCAIEVVPLGAQGSGSLRAFHLSAFPDKALANIQRTYWNQQLTVSPRTDTGVRSPQKRQYSTAPRSMRAPWVTRLWM